MSTAKIPTTVITGFLGAGKTTLIRHMLQNAGGRRLGLLINEFGDVGVDGEILKACGSDVCDEDDIIELANGCICCTVADDFVPALEKLLNRPDPPQHIVIETSGLALPQPLIRAFNWPEIKSRVTVDGVIAVVDAKALAEGRFADDEAALAEQRAADPNLDHDNPIEEVFQDQLTCADLVVLNKTDLLDPSESSRLSDELQGKLRTGTRVVSARKGALASDILIGFEAAAESDVASRPSHHELEGEAEHDHDDFESFVVSLGVIDDREDLLARISETMRENDVLRLKGFVAIEGGSARLLVQGVGPRLDSYFDRPWLPGEARRTELVVIGLKGLDRERITAQLSG
ncbi:MAG: cobalamin biosynthesis protein CobW [Rhizobiales bacterium]|nr:cobalamin biosynthesis protein CobW [Hyphomicrobiales bacterium]